MIERLQKIGASVLSGSLDNSMSEVEQRKAKLLELLTVPTIKKDGMKKAICINFNLNEGTFAFEEDVLDLIPENKHDLFALNQGGNAKRIFSATNSIDYLISKFIDDSKDYLTKCRKGSKSKKWFADNIKTDYDEFVDSIKSIFYSNVNGLSILNYNKLTENQKQQYMIIQNELSENGQKVLNSDIIEKSYKKLIFDIFNTNADKISNVFLMRFNGKTILEHSKNCSDSYINLMYYYFMYDSIINGKDCKNCHLCEKTNTIVTSDFPINFFGKTNSLFFEDLKSSNAYKALSMCQECLEKLIVGNGYIENYFGSYAFDMTYYIIPDLKNNTKIEKECKKILRVLEKRDKSDIDSIKELSNKIEKFDLMFYERNKNSFAILKLISNIDIKKYLQKYDLFTDFNYKYKLYDLGDYNYLAFSDIRNYVFPSKDSHSKLDFKIYGKKLLDFLDDFLTGKPISYNFLISSFMDIAKLRYHKDRYDKLSAFKLNIFITMLNELNMLKGERMETTGHYITEIAKKEYADFFATHQAVYADNSFRQGLFLLGTVIAQIIQAQKKKNNYKENSPSFLDKLNFDGISPRRIQQLVNQVKEYSLIYKTYEEQGIWANITDRLQGIEQIQMRPDEVLFYILSGVSYEDYKRDLRIAESAQKNDSQNVNNATQTETTNLN